MNYKQCSFGKCFLALLGWLDWGWGVAASASHLAYKDCKDYEMICLISCETFVNKSAQWNAIGMSKGFRHFIVCVILSLPRILPPVML